jgi:hypothetical protein
MVEKPTKDKMLKEKKTTKKEMKKQTQQVGGASPKTKSL